MNIKRHVLTSSLWSFLGSAGEQVFGFFLFIYLARQLTPADIGLIALAVVFVDIFGTMSRYGQVEALQRYVDLNHTIASTSFWMLLASGVVSCALVALIGSSLGSLSGYAPLGTVLLALAPLCALQAWNAVPEAILKQRLEFRTLTIRTWSATAVGGALAVYLAHRGFGVYALVGQRLGGAAMHTIMLWALSRWKPRFVFDGSEAKRLAAIGSEIMLAGLSNTVNLRIADAVTGVFLGAQQLGFLRLAWRFYDVVALVGIMPISSVALSSFSKLRDNRETLQRAYVRLTQFMALASLPFFFGLGAVADVFVPLIFGSKWLPAASALQLISLAILPATINYLFASLMVAVGATRYLLKQSVAQVFVTGLFISIGARWGVEGVLFGHIARATVISGYNLYVMNRMVAISPSRALKVVVPPAIACGVMLLTVSVAKDMLNTTLPAVPLLASLVAIGAAIYVFTLLAGDALGLWRGYVSSAARSMAGAFPKRPQPQSGTSIA